MTFEITPLQAAMLTSSAEPSSEVRPAACPACGGAGCESCSQTGQAEFCAADAGAGPARAMDLHGLARTEDEVEQQRVLICRLFD
jgi:hypothetical protein